MTKLIVAFALLLALSIPLFAVEEPPTTGVLVVTYHTGRNGERLDRVRFRLINEQKEQTMYPRAGTFYDKAAANTRRVTIPDLPPGHYTIEFIAPNQDGLFGDLRSREVTIYSGEISKIDQALKPHYARVKATGIIPEMVMGVGPTLRLTDIHGNLLAISHDGNLETHNLLPGQYTISFDPYADLVPPDPIHFHVAASTVVGPFERHYQKPGQEQAKVDRRRIKSQPDVATAISASPVLHDNIPSKSQGTELALVGHPSPTRVSSSQRLKRDTPPMLSLMHPDANRLVPITGKEPHEVAIAEQPASLTVRAAAPSGSVVEVILRHEHGKEVKLSLNARNDQIEGIFRDLPPGNYHLSFELPDFYFAVPSQEIALEPGQSRVWNQPLTEARAIRVTTNSDQAVYTLTEIATGKEWQASGRRHVFERLSTGEYRLTFFDAPNSHEIAPESKIIHLAPDSDSYINAVYHSTP